MLRQFFLLVNLAHGHLRRGSTSGEKPFEQILVTAEGFEDIAPRVSGTPVPDATVPDANVTNVAGPDKVTGRTGRGLPPGQVGLVEASSATLSLLKSFRTCGRCSKSDEDFIRVGKQNGDGGYMMCPSTTKEITAAFSVGIRGSDGWGIQLSQASGARVHEYDCTSEKVKCPVGAQRCNLQFNHICLGARTEKKKGLKTLDAIVLEASPNRSDIDLVLKMDCEGCEWSVFDDADDETLKRFKTILVEFHWLEEEAHHEKYLRVMQKLLKHFDIVHTHGCNCFGKWTVRGTGLGMPSIVETTFIREDRGAKSACIASRYLSGLDKPTCKHKSAEFTAADFALE